MRGGDEDLQVAVIGMACRVPGADDVEAFWENLRAGVESIEFFGPEEALASGVSPELLAHPGYVRAGGILADPEAFDAGFFAIGPREAQALDPQHRVFLETAWLALERAGYDARHFSGSVGVFGGASRSDHLLRVLASPALREAIPGTQALVTTGVDFLATRAAYMLNLRGPAVTVQTACSTSLSAVHLACQSLLAGECDVALAGGVSITLPQRTGHVYEPGGILSRDGHCRAFDAEASGTVRGNGVGIVVLKRLPEARRDGDRISAVIRGWAMNNDAANRVGFTAPGVEGQTRVVRTALAMAGVEPRTIGYVEAHGTGTSLGDPIEVAALTQALRRGEGPSGFCAIGSVKTNIGHLDAAAGVAGLIKVVLMLEHGELVPSLHFSRPNPQIDFDQSPVYVNTRSTPWTSADRLRRAGISSFGIGGTNVHLVLEEAPAPAPRSPSRGPEAFLLSARTPGALEEATDRLAAHLRQHPGLRATDVAFTLAAGRQRFTSRRAVVADDLEEAALSLADRDATRVWSGVAPAEGRAVAFLFSGQGSQYPDMGRGLYETEAAFREEVDAACEVLRGPLGLDLRGLLFPDAATRVNVAAALEETRFTQPALFVVEFALARLWKSWGVEPEAMLGHSVGEYVAACLAGVMTRDDALLLVAERGRLMQACPRGAMLAIALPEEAVRLLIGGSLALSAVNGPDACVVGGAVEEIDRLAGRLEERKVPHARVATSHAFHSPLMSSACAPFAERLAAVRLAPPRLPFVSNVTGTWIKPDEAIDPAYWVRHLTETVQFSAALDVLRGEPRRALLEVGPGHTLIALARRRSARGHLALSSLRHPRESIGDSLFIRQTAARLWTAGVGVDLHRGGRGDARRVLLPTHPLERSLYTIDPPRQPPSTTPAATEGVPGWLHIPSWKRAGEAAEPLPAGGGEWCVFAGTGARSDAVVAALRARGASVSVVRWGAGYARLGDREWILDPFARADYERIFDEMKGAGGMPPCFLHLWGMEGAPAAHSDAGVDSLFLGLLRLGQAAGPRADRPTVLTVVTCGVQDVTGTEPLSPWRSTALGLVRVIPQEYPLLACRSLDVEEATPSDRIVLDALELSSSGPREPIVARRGLYRWIQSFEPQPALNTRHRALRERGVYLITGGLGKVGLALARHLALSVKARLVLTGRSATPDVPAVRELEAHGAEVLVMQADAADAAEMAEVLVRSRERFGGLNGVIHCAGDIGHDVLCPLAAVEPSRCERQLRPKARGVEVLDAVLAGEALDFVLLTSSLSTVLGGVGLTAYAAANQFLDTFARRQHQRGRHEWTSVDWDGWTFSPPSDAGPQAESAILPGEGGEALDRVLALGGVPQVVVSKTSLAERRARWTVGLGESLDGAEEDAAKHARPDLLGVYVAPEDGVERRLAEIWARVLGVEPIGRDDNFFELGGSSLLAVHLMGKVRREFAADLTAAALFDAPTVRALADRIRTPGSTAYGLTRSLERGQMRRRSRERASDAAVE